MSAAKLCLLEKDLGCKCLLNASYQGGKLKCLLGYLQEVTTSEGSDGSLPYYFDGIFDWFHPQPREFESELFEYDETESGKEDEQAQIFEKEIDSRKEAYHDQQQGSEYVIDIVEETLSTDSSEGLEETDLQGSLDPQQGSGHDAELSDESLSSDILDTSIQLQKEDDDAGRSDSDDSIAVAKENSNLNYNPTEPGYGTPKKYKVASDHGDLYIIVNKVQEIKDGVVQPGHYNCKFFIHNSTIYCEWEVTPTPSIQSKPVLRPPSSYKAPPYVAPSLPRRAYPYRRTLVPDVRRYRKAYKRPTGVDYRKYNGATQSYSDSTSTSTSSLSVQFGGHNRDSQIKQMSAKPGLLIEWARRAGTKSKRPTNVRSVSYAMIPSEVMDRSSDVMSLRRLASLLHEDLEEYEEYEEDVSPMDRMDAYDILFEKTM